MVLQERRKWDVGIECYEPWILPRWIRWMVFEVVVVGRVKMRVAVFV
jgi:hypothetical protein